MLKTFTIDDQTIRRLAFGFILFLFVFEIYGVGVNYSNYFVYLIESETYLFSAIALLCIIASYALLLRLISFAIASSWPFKAICFLIFFVSVSVEYGYQKALGRFSDKIDIETALASTPEQKTASILMYLSFKALVPCIILLGLFIFFRAEKRRGIKGFIVANVLLITGFALFPLVVAQKFPTISVGAFYRTNIDFLMNGPLVTGKWASAITGVEVHRREVTPAPLPDDYRPNNNIVILIDESARGDHFGINRYARDTTPLLNKLASQNILHNWGIAVAASTGSRFTYSALVTGLTPDDFPDKGEVKVNTTPTIFQYAKAMKYKTYFFDGQMNGYWGGIEDDKKFIDEWHGILDVSDHKAFETWALDDLIAKKVKDIIYSSTGNLIFVFKHGSHIPYHSNFPADQTIWSPSYETASKFDIPAQDRLPEVLNAYDNSIRYNVNSFFKNLIDDYTRIPNNSIILYTGDHGQTLFVNGRSSHGGNTKEEACVPLFMVGAIDAKADTTYKASHQNIFPTILDLIGYPSDLRDPTSVPSLLTATSADSKPRYFNPDLGTKIPYD